MKIKDHPNIIKNIYGAWSPSHTTMTSGTGHKFPSGNVDDCILKEAKNHPDHVDLVLEYQGQQTHVSEPFADLNFAKKFCDKLNADCIGKTIKDIGDIDINF